MRGKNIFGVVGTAEIINTKSESRGLANAITSKGVPTSTGASLSAIEDNIRQIRVGNYIRLTGLCLPVCPTMKLIMI